MLIFDANNKAIILDNIYAPIVADHFWILDLNIMDFTLVPLQVLEEITSPTIQVTVEGFSFNLPATWNMLVVDEYTMQLDVAEVSELAGKQFCAFVYGANLSAFRHPVITVTDYYLSRKNVGPSLNKHQMLCHPISPTSWVVVSPSDTYNKYLKDCIAGDLT